MTAIRRAYEQAKWERALKREGELKAKIDFLTRLIATIRSEIAKARYSDQLTQARAELERLLEQEPKLRKGF